MKFIPCLFLSFFVFVGASFARKPNVILIMADDLGYSELGSYGQKKIKTPAWTSWPRKGCPLAGTIPAMRYAPLPVAPS